MYAALCTQPRAHCPPNCDTQVVLLGGKMFGPIYLVTVGIGLSCEGKSNEWALIKAQPCLVLGQIPQLRAPVRSLLDSARPPVKLCCAVREQFNNFHSLTLVLSTTLSN